MPKLSWSFDIPAGATFLPISVNGWQYEYVPVGGIISILQRAEATGVLVTVTTGSETLQERSPVSAGGTEGVMPSALDVPALVDEVAMGDRIKISYENTTVAAIFIDGEIEFKA